MWSCAHKTLRSGVERAGYRSSEGWGEVVLHPKWSCWRYGHLEELDCQAATLFLQAQAENLSVEEYIMARDYLSTRQNLRLRGVCEDLAEL